MGKGQKRDGPDSVDKIRRERKEQNRSADGPDASVTARPGSVPERASRARKPANRMGQHFMLLWTWQRKGFSITDGGVQVDSRRYSDYLSGDYSSAGFKQAYEDLWRILGTDQFHWYYTLEKDARKPSDINQGKMLWTVKAPEEGILCRVCDCAWTTLAGEPLRMPPDWLGRAYGLLKEFNDKAGAKPYLKDKYARDFMAGWSEMNREDLLGRLLVRCAHVDCIQVLLRHPIPKEWIAREPEEYFQVISSLPR